ncbi:hypothetical protein ABR772_25720 [Bacillus cereus]|uniref:hypothetical protein n=1 Tax=Bacillus cereus TaxID=1396 RepID=UPI00355742B3
MKTVTMQKNVNVMETLSNGLMAATTHKYKEMAEVLKSENEIEVHYVYGQEKRRVKQLTEWGFELKETIYHNSHALHAGIRQVWARPAVEEVEAARTVTPVEPKEVPAEDFASHFSEGDEVQVYAKKENRKFEGVVLNVFPDSNEIFVSINNGDDTFTRLFFNSPENSLFTIKTYEYKEGATAAPAVGEVQEEAAPLEIKKADFASKPANVTEVKQYKNSVYVSYAVEEEIVLSSDEFYFLSSNLGAEQDFLKGKGGTRTTTEPEGIEHLEHFYQMTEEQRKQWLKGSYRNCVKVTCPTATYSLLIDPQGYNYARYVAIEYK